MLNPAELNLKATAPREWLDAMSTVADVDRVVAFLTEQGTFRFPALPNGLFSAALGDGGDFALTGYANIWVRDNIHIAHAHWIIGERSAAAKTMRAILDFYRRHQQRFVDIIEGRADAEDPMQRPHIRFNGTELSELPEKWSHAQNDALGYWLWLTSKLAIAGELVLAAADVSVLVDLLRYWEKIKYWQDADSGHWEETRKVAMSSIGVAVGGLREFRLWLGTSAGVMARELAPGVDTLAERLWREGIDVLGKMLPHEWAIGIGDRSPLRRRTDLPDVSHRPVGSGRAERGAVQRGHPPDRAIRNSALPRRFVLVCRLQDAPPSRRAHSRFQRRPGCPRPAAQAGIGSPVVHLRSDPVSDLRSTVPEVRSRHRPRSAAVSPPAITRSTHPSRVAIWGVSLPGIVFLRERSVRAERHYAAVVDAGESAAGPAFYAGDECRSGRCVVSWNFEASERAGWIQTVDVFDELGSTNDHAIATADDSRPHPRLIVCDRQVAGRGRGANRWWASEGALTFSVVIEPDQIGIPLGRWPTLSVAVGGAICEALAPIVPQADIRLKWPNDVYADGRKLCGILVEVPPVTPRRLVIGIGINVANSARNAPPEVQARMTSLADLTAPVPSRSEVLAHVLAQLRIDLMCLATDPVSLAPGWRQRCLLLGRTVTLNDGIRTLTGACQGIDDDGALRIYSEFGPQRCLGGTIEAFE